MQKYNLKLVLIHSVFEVCSWYYMCIETPCICVFVYVKLLGIPFSISCKASPPKLLVANESPLLLFEKG